MSSTCTCWHERDTSQDSLHLDSSDMSAPFRLYFTEKPARLSICQSQPKLLQIMGRQCCFPDLLLLFSFPSFYSTAFYCLVLPTFYCFVFLVLYCLLSHFLFCFVFPTELLLVKRRAARVRNPDASFSIGATFCCDSPLPPSPSLVRFCFWHGDHLEPMLCPQGDAGCHKAAREATSHHVMLITAAAVFVLVKEKRNHLSNIVFHILALYMAHLGHNLGQGTH